MTRYLGILALATIVAACSGDKGSTNDTGATTNPGDDDDDDSACTNSATAVFPTQGDADVYYRTKVRFALDTEDATAAIAVTDNAGTEVPGSSTVTGKEVLWTGSAPLSPSTEYTATASYECGNSAITFTTSTTGSPTEVDVTGSTFALDVANGQWLEPAGVGTLLASQLGDTQIFVSPTAVDAASVTMFGAIGSGGTQDLCSPSIPFPAADFEDPYFSLQSDLLPLVISGFVINIQDLDLSGAFSPDGTRIQGASLRGSVDTRPLGEVFDLGTAEDAVCQFVAGIGVNCVACSDGSGDYCLSVLVENIEAPVINGLTLQERTEDDIAQDPTCN
ncbi:MAG: hypothetical protein R3F59_29900 [Myxococcota bacterium]